MLKAKNIFGTMTWRPPNPRRSLLQYVPAYADVLAGDTIVTSGYSNVFPENIPVGLVDEVTTPRGSNSHEIIVRLFADMGRLNFVQVIENINKSQLDSLTSDQPL